MARFFSGKAVGGYHNHRQDEQKNYQSYVRRFAVCDFQADRQKQAPG